MRNFLEVLKIVLTIAAIIAFCWFIIWALKQFGIGISDIFKNFWR